MDLKPNRIKLAVRELVEKTERSGDINFRFSSRSSAQEGIKGHQKVQKSRGEGYIAEKKVSGVFESEGLNIEIGGRVDGYFIELIGGAEEDLALQEIEQSSQSRSAIKLWVEEIKTTRMDVSQIPANIERLNWGQARVYAHLLALEYNLPAQQNVLLKLCYYHLDDEVEYIFEENWSCEELETYFYDLLGRYARWQKKRQAWQTRRNIAIAAVAFPFAGYRKGQREMAVSVYQTMRRQQQLVIQAPTGIGKTMASIFPSLKAMGEFGYDKLFYLSAKTSGQSMAAAAVNDLREGGLIFRDITLTAKDKICFTPGAPCDSEHCPYAAGYYDKLPLALEETIAAEVSLTKSTIEKIARKFSMCPFELSLDLSEISDMVICDYNYVFDPAVYLRRYFIDAKSDEAHGKYGFLIDEAHNLVDRGRDMFSAELTKETLMVHKREQKDALPLVSKRLNAINSEILKLIRPHKAMLETAGYLVLETYPEKLAKSLRLFCDAAEDWLHEPRGTDQQAKLLGVYFDCLRFLRLGELFDGNYSCLILHRSGSTIIKLYNINPAPGLAEGLKRSFASVCFSATMGPQSYFESLMGVSEDANWYKIPAPFDPSHLGVFVPRYISTIYRDRDNSLDELVTLIADIVSHRAGNYLVFFPSYAYLNEAHGNFCDRFTQFNTISQKPTMDDDARQTFLGKFESPQKEAPLEEATEGSTQDTLVGFAIMGGIFGEGIDLKGNKLIGVIVVGVGLPQMGIERDLIKRYFNGDFESDTMPENYREHITGNGFEFAYQYPGVNRVLQTAGRLIRSDTDRGILCLVDNRFNENRYQKLLPDHWNIEGVKSPAHLNRAVRDFWQGINS
ncbi:MAG: Rad3-related DNA helicase [Candidatus Azotimanducaceae bacterium]|jgi:Rad3-related DNA helicase